MELGTGSGQYFKKEKELIKLDENTDPDIANKIRTKKKNNFPENNINPINKININFDKKNEGTENRINEFDTKSEQSLSTIKSMTTNKSALSKLDCSEREIENGELFFYEVKKGSEYVRYSFFEYYKKEVDGIYYSHSDIKLVEGKRNLNLDGYKGSGEYVKEISNSKDDNDLKGCIIMKNFEEDVIPKDAPFILEIKAGFELIEILKQIAKSSKYVHNLQNYKGILPLPKYFIGILCSLSKSKTVNNQFHRLKQQYDGCNYEDKVAQINLLKHITQIIGKDIKIVIAVIKNSSINGYTLKRDDYDINPNYKRVELSYMYKTISKTDNLNEEELEKKISNVSEKFKDAYNTLNNVKMISIPYSQKNDPEKKIKKKSQKHGII